MHCKEHALLIVELGAENADALISTSRRQIVAKMGRLPGVGNAADAGHGLRRERNE